MGVVLSDEPRKASFAFNRVLLKIACPLTLHEGKEQQWRTVNGVADDNETLICSLHAQVVAVVALNHRPIGDVSVFHSALFTKPICLGKRIIIFPIGDGDEVAPRKNGNSGQKKHKGKISDDDGKSVFATRKQNRKKEKSEISGDKREDIAEPLLASAGKLDFTPVAHSASG